jgi:hypothetical protein
MADEKRIRLEEVPAGDELAHGISARGMREGMSAATAGGKAMTGSGAQRPVTPPPKPVDAGNKPKPK